MTFVGHGWRSGQSGDTTTGAVSTATVTTLTPATAARSAKTIVLTVTGTGFVAGTVVYAGFNPQATVYVNGTTLRCDTFNVVPDNGQAGTINVGARKPGERVSGTRPFTVT